MASIYRIIRDHAPKIESASATSKLDSLTQKHLRRSSPNQKLNVSIRSEENNIKSFPTAFKDTENKEVDNSGLLYNVKKDKKYKKKFDKHLVDYTESTIDGLKDRPLTRASSLELSASKMRTKDAPHRENKYKKFLHKQESSEPVSVPRSDTELRSGYNRKIIDTNKTLKPRKLHSHKSLTTLIRDGKSKSTHKQEILSGRVMHGNPSMQPGLKHVTKATIFYDPTDNPIQSNLNTSKAKNKITGNDLHTKSIGLTMYRGVNNANFINVTDQQFTPETTSDHHTKIIQNTSDDQKLSQSLLRNSNGVSNSNPSVPMQREDLIASVIHELDRNLDFTEGNRSYANETLQPSFLAKAADNDSGESRRKERVINDTEIAEPTRVYRSTVHFMENLFSYVSSHPVAVMMTLSLTVSVFFTTIGLIMICRFRNRESKGGKKDDSKNKKSRKKSTHYNPSWSSKTFKNEDDALYFSIGSDSKSSNEEDEEEEEDDIDDILSNRRSKCPPRESSAILEKYDLSLEKEDGFGLQNRKIFPNASESPSLKLSRLHRSLSSRNGNAYPSDTSKGAKLSPILEGKTSQKKKSPVKKSRSFPGLSAIISDKIKNKVYPKSPIKDEDSDAKLEFIKDAKMDKKVVFSSENEMEQDCEEKSDSNNPFDET